MVSGQPEFDSRISQKVFYHCCQLPYLLGTGSLAAGNFPSYTSSRHTPEKVPHIAFSGPVEEYTLETRASGFEYKGLHDFPWSG
jgi:hypothetical protein